MGQIVLDIGVVQVQRARCRIVAIALLIVTEN